MTTNTTEHATAAPWTADQQRKITAALLRYRVLAWTAGIWLLILTGDVIAKYIFDVHTPAWIAVVHGWVYFVYLLLTADLAVKVRWPAVKTVLTLLAGTIPFMSFYFEHTNARELKARLAA